MVLQLTSNARLKTEIKILIIEKRESCVDRRQCIDRQHNSFLVDRTFTLRFQSRVSC